MDVSAEARSVPDYEEKYQQANGLHRTGGKPGKVVNVCGAGGSASIRKPNNYRVVGKVPKERAGRAAHPETAP